MCICYHNCHEDFNENMDATKAALGAFAPPFISLSKCFGLSLTRDKTELQEEQLAKCRKPGQPYSTEVGLH